MKKQLDKKGYCKVYSDLSIRASMRFVCYYASFTPLSSQHFHGHRMNSPKRFDLLGINFVNFETSPPSLQFVCLEVSQLYRGIAGIGRCVAHVGKPSIIIMR